MKQPKGPMWNKNSVRTYSPGFEFAVVACIILFSVAVRLINYPQDIEFKADQAGDLLVVHAMVREGRYPPVGPPLSVEGFHIPPTYYYILAALYSAGKSPEGVVLGLIAFHAVTLLLVYSIARRWGDFTFGLIILTLFACSYVIDMHARSIWQPNVLTFFIVLYIWLLTIAWRTKNELVLLASLSCYAIGLTIYPSPLLLLPHVCFSAYRIFRSKKYSPWRSVIVSGLFIIVPILFLSRKYIVYEWTHHFPTVQAVFSDAFTPKLQLGALLGRYRNNSILLFGELFHFWDVASTWYAVLHYISLFVYAYWLTTVLRVANAQLRDPPVQYKQAYRILAPAALLTGFIGVVFLQLRDDPHRIWVFLPFLIFIFGLCIRLAVHHQSRIFRLSVLLYAFFYITSNTALVGLRLNSLSYSDRAVIKTQARYMYDTAAEHGVHLEDIRLVSYIPGDHENYDVLTYLYELHTLYGYPVVFAEAGNDADRASMNSPASEYVYLTCSYYPTIELVKRDCLGYFLASHTEYDVITQRLFGGNKIIFLVRKMRNI